MKRIYLVKKDPGMPASEDNWTVMDRNGFFSFLETPEGQRREKEFGQLNAAGARDAVIVAECGKERAGTWRREVNRDRYLRDRGKGAGFGPLPWGALPALSGDGHAEQGSFRDGETDVEEAVVGKIRKEELRRAVASLGKGERDLILRLYLSEDPVTEREYAAETGSTRGRIHERKRAALRKLRKMLGDGTCP